MPRRPRVLTMGDASKRVDPLTVATMLAAQHRVDEARSIAETETVRNRNRFDAWVLLAKLDLQARRFEQAANSASRALKLNPGHWDALYTLGRCYKAQGDLPSAETCYRKAIAANPSNPDLCTSFGILLRERDRIEEAIAMYRRALELRPDHPAANHNLGNALRARGSPLEAQGYQAEGRALLVKDLDRLRAVIIASLGSSRIGDALAALDQAFAISPDAVVGWLTGGDITVELGRRGLNSVRLRYAEEAVRRAPRSAQAVDLARRICVLGGLYERAVRYSAMAYEIAPSTESLFAGKLALPAIPESNEDIRTARARYDQGLDEILASGLPVTEPSFSLGPMSFYLAYHGQNDRDLQVKAARAYLRVIPDLAMTAQHCLRPVRRPGRIRIGFISKFLASHSIGKTTRGLIEQLSREHFEVFALRITPSADDEVTALIRASADHTVSLDPTFAQARRQIADLELDILFFQDIGMEPMSYFIAFARLAPIQCVSFGHPDTTGIPNMDYFISNDLFEASEASSHYSERLILLRDLPTLAYYYRPAATGPAPDRAAFGFPADATLYLCPQTPFKIHPDFDPMIAGILRRDPRGLVALIKGEYEEWGEALQRRFNLAMPDVAHRVVQIPRMRTMDFLHLLALADVVLDTLHFNGMNSSLEAFAMGTPVVTRPTTLQRGRHTQAMYQKMGISDCIATDADDYVNIAVRLGTDRQFAQSIRERLRTASHALFEDRRVVEEFERFFLQAVRALPGADTLEPTTHDEQQS
jgi:predicted O-linked N-acetylglucosamine transferase (SPINDLY family)